MFVPIWVIVLTALVVAVHLWHWWRWSITNFRKVVVSSGYDEIVEYVHKSAVDRCVRAYLDGRIEQISRISVYERPIPDSKYGSIDWTDCVCRYNERDKHPKKA